MSAIALLYIAATPFVSGRYSEKWRYYTWLIILVGLIIPFRPQMGGAIVTIESRANGVAYATPAEAEAAIHFSASEAATHSTALFVSWWQIAFVVWLGGMAAFLACHIVKHYRFMKTVRRWSSEITDTQILSLYEKVKRELKITKHIPLYLCHFGSPMVVGLIKPRIFLPSEEMARDDLLFILKHELVHYKRRDVLYKYVIMLATSMHWFNPVVHLMAKAINMLCETSCDAEVVQSEDINTRHSYSETLIGVVKNQSRMKTALATSFHGGKKGVKNRISSIMDIRLKKAGVAIACAVVFLTIGTGFVFATAHSEATLESRHTIVCVDRNIRFALTNATHELTANPETARSNLTFEEVAQIASSAIYREFGFCIGGTIGFIGFSAFNGSWHGGIAPLGVTEIITEQDLLFTFMVDDFNRAISVWKN